MKNRTLYEVLDNVMQDYRYEIKKTKNKVELNGSVFIPRLEVTIEHKMEFYCTDTSEKDVFRSKIDQFKDELRSLVAKKLKEHEEELTDDEAFIDKLLYEIKSLTGKLEETKKALEVANHKISSLEFEKSIQSIPYPAVPTTNPNPWSTGITWDTVIGDYPGWNDKLTTDGHPDIGSENPWVNRSDGVYGVNKSGKY